jgi:mono/diheme cytochrome c family protein
MKARMVRTTKGVLLLFWFTTTAALGATQNPGNTEQLTLVVSKGNPSAGRKAFQDLLCISCHRVKGESGFQKPIAGYDAPSLGYHEKDRTASEVATSIILPSHNIAEEIKKRIKSDVSPMTDYSDAITIRQLTDLVAYLRSIQ